MNNKNIFMHYVLIICVFAFCSCSTFSIIKKPENTPSGNVSITTPEVSTWTLSNGLKVLFYHQEEIPVTNVSLYLPKGDLSNDTEIPGLTKVTVSQMREGGISEMTPDEFDSLLDKKAAHIETSVNDEITSVSLSCLSEDFEELLKLYSSLIKNPAFNKERFELWKRLAFDTIMRRKDSPSTMASMTYNLALYGEDSNWNQVITTNVVRSLTLNELKKMHQRMFLPEGANLIVTSNLNESLIKEKIEKSFSDWEDKSNLEPLERFYKKKPEHKPLPAVYVLERDFEQANVILAHKSASREETPLYKQSLFNRVLGSSGFGSILFTEIREKRGLAYSVYGGFSDSITDGSFRVILGTKSDKAYYAFLKTYELLSEIKDGYLPSKQIEAARSALMKNFVFKYEDPEYAAKRPVLLSMYNYPENYDEVYVDKISQVTHDELRSFASKSIKIEDLFTVIVGDVMAEDVKKHIGDSTQVCKVSFGEIPKVENCF